MSRFSSELGPQAGTRGLLWPSRTRAATLPPRPPSNLGPSPGAHPTQDRTGRVALGTAAPAQPGGPVCGPRRTHSPPPCQPACSVGAFLLPGLDELSASADEGRLSEKQKAPGRREPPSVLLATFQHGSQTASVEPSLPSPDPLWDRELLPSPLQTDALLSRGCPVPQAPLLDCRARVEAVPQPQQGLTCEELSLTGPRSPWGPAAPGLWAFGSDWLIRGALFCRPRVFYVMT